MKKVKGKVEEIPRTKILAKRTEGNRRKITTNIAGPGTR